MDDSIIFCAKCGEPNLPTAMRCTYCHVDLEWAEQRRGRINDDAILGSATTNNHVNRVQSYSSSGNLISECAVAESFSFQTWLKSSLSSVVRILLFILAIVGLGVLLLVAISGGEFVELICQRQYLNAPVTCIKRTERLGIYLIDEVEIHGVAGAKIDKVVYSDIDETTDLFNLLLITPGEEVPLLSNHTPIYRDLHKAELAINDFIQLGTIGSFEYSDHGVLEIESLIYFIGIPLVVFGGFFMIWRSREKFKRGRLPLENQHE